MQQFLKAGLIFLSPIFLLRLFLLNWFVLRIVTLFRRIPIRRVLIFIINQLLVLLFLPVFVQLREPLLPVALFEQTDHVCTHLVCFRRARLGILNLLGEHLPVPHDE